MKAWKDSYYFMFVICTVFNNCGFITCHFSGTSLGLNFSYFAFHWVGSSEGLKINQTPFFFPMIAHELVHDRDICKYYGRIKRKEDTGGIWTIFYAAWILTFFCCLMESVGIDSTDILNLYLVDWKIGIFFVLSRSWVWSKCSINICWEMKITIDSYILIYT